MEGNKGNPNPVQTDSFKEAAKANEFNSETGKAAAERPRPRSRMRSEQQLISDKMFDPEKLDQELADWVRLNPTGARIMISRMYEKIVKKMQPELVARWIDDVDGKGVQPTQEIPPPTLLPEDCPTEEAAAAAHAQFARTP